MICGDCQATTTESGYCAMCGRYNDAAPVEIAGPQGRAYVTLPCGHRASLDWSRGEYVATRTCRCGIRYKVTVSGDGETASVYEL